MDIKPLMSTMLSLFAAMAVGFLAAKSKLINADFNKQLSNFVLKVLQPIMILASVLNSEHLMSNAEVFETLAVALAYFLVLIALSRPITMLLRVKPDDVPTYRFLLIFSNIGFLGYPVINAIYGPDASFYVTIFVLVFQITIFSYGLHVMSGAKERFRLHPSIFKHPVVLTCIVTILIYLLDIRVPPMLASAVSYLGNLASPLIMLVAGCSLASCAPRQVFGNARVYLLAAIKLLVMPLLSYVILHPLLGDSILFTILIVFLAAPAASAAAAFAILYDGDEALASSGVFVTTLACILTIPFIIWLLFAR